MQDNFRFRPGSAYSVGLPLLAILAAVALAEILSTEISGALPLVSWLGVLGWLICVVLILPCAEIVGESLRIVNPFRTIRVKIREITAIDTKFFLDVHTQSQKFSVIAAMAPSRYRVARTDPSGLKIAGDLVDSPLIRPGDILDSDSGALGFVLRKRMREVSERYGQVARTDATTKIQINWIALGSGALFLAIAVAINSASLFNG